MKPKSMKQQAWIKSLKAFRSKTNIIIIIFDISIFNEKTLAKVEKLLWKYLNNENVENIYIKM